MHYLYRITDALNNKVYIGQSNKENERWRQHKYFARQEEPIQYVHRAMKKYGTEHFIYEVIAICRTQEDADEVESQLIKQYDSRNKDYGYNIAPGGDHAWNAGLPKEQQPMYGKKQSEYFLQRMSEVHTGKTVIHSEEWKDNMSDIMTGRIITDEWKEKLSLSNKGQTRSLAARQKMSSAHKGKTASPETRQKMSITKMGKTKSKETIERMSKSKMGLYAAEKSHNSKTTWEIIRKIREEYFIGTITQKELGIKYNMSTNNVQSIITYKTWKE